MNSPRRPMTAANGYSLLEPADCARATKRRIIAISDASESCLVMALTFAVRQTVKRTSGFASVLKIRMVTQLRLTATYRFELSALSSRNIALARIANDLLVTTVLPKIRREIKTRRTMQVRQTLCPRNFSGCRGNKSR